MVKSSALQAQLQDGQTAVNGANYGHMVLSFFIFYFFLIYFLFFVFSYELEVNLCKSEVEKRY